MHLTKTLLLGLAMTSLCACDDVLNLGEFNGATLADDDAASGFYDGSDGSPGDAATGAVDASVVDASGSTDATEELADAVEAAPFDAGDATAQEEGDAGIDGTLQDVLEGASDVTVVDTSDAASDVGALDAQDGASDSAPDANEAGPVDWCLANSTVATILCRDFDDNKPWGYLFDSASDSFGIPVPVVTATDCVSPPSSLLLQLPLLDAGQSGNIQLTQHLQYHGAVDVSAAVKLVGFEGGLNSDLELLRVSYNSGTYWVSWGLGSTSAGVEETIASVDAGNTYIGHTAVLPPLGTWFNVLLHVDFGANSVSLTVNGVVMVSSTISNPPLGQGASLSVTVGVNWVSGPEAATQIYYDNVLINAQ
ncbi:MAG: hypothetical protein ABTD50_21395 [Polyangiaceae bacterium]|jgi:hypothetical protein